MKTEKHSAAGKAQDPGKKGWFSARNAVMGTTSAAIDSARRNEMISEAAYYRAQRRGFGWGYELDDWLGAQSQIDAELTVEQLHAMYGK